MFNLKYKNNIYNRKIFGKKIYNKIHIYTNKFAHKQKNSNVM